MYPPPPPPSKFEEYPPTMGIPVAPPAMQQPSPGIPVAPQRWSSGLCDCTQDVANCCITCWCPCITFGQIAEIVDRGEPSCGASGALYALILCLSVSLFGTGCQWIYSCAYRSKIRAIYSLPEEPCNDCILHFCCECCSLCQLHRELKHLGFDMAIGWHANMEKQAYAATQPPVVPEGMMR